MPHFLSGRCELRIESSLPEQLKESLNCEIVFGTGEFMEKHCSQYLNVPLAVNQSSDICNSGQQN